MHSLIQVQGLLLLAIASLVAGAPSSFQIQKRSFKVTRVPNPAYVGRTPGAGTRALIKAHRKFKFDLPQGLLETMMSGTPDAGVGGNNKAKSSNTGIRAASPQSTGKVTATPVNGDVEYLSPVNIGGQVIDFDFDTGSSDLWVFSTQLNQASIGNHTTYDMRKSSTFKPMEGQTFKISYGDGSGASGIVGTDTVDIGGAVVTEQAIEMATTVSQSFTQDTGSNGLVGLAFSKLNTVKPTPQKTFFDNVMPNLAMPVFTADLRKNAVGAYEFGVIDSSKFTGSLTWAPVNTANGFWQFSTSKFQVADQPAIESPGGQAIADTGTTLMLTSASIVNAYYSQVKGAVNDPQVGGVTFPCKSVLPDLKVDVGGSYMANIRGSDINFAPVDQAMTTCFGGVQAIQSNLQIYGDIMFKSQFVAFNGGNNTIGMAPHS